MPIFSFGAIPSTVNEGDLLQIAVSANEGVPNGTLLYWDAIGTSSPEAVAADFTNGVNSGSVYFTNNVAYIYISIAADQLSELSKFGKDKFLVGVKLAGNVHPQAQTGVISINDTSQTPPITGYVVSKNESIYTGILNSVEYAVNGGSWTSMGGTITVPPNATVQYRATYTKTSGARVYIEMSESFGAYAAGSTTSTSTIYTTTSSPVTSNSTLSIILSPTQI